MVDVQPPHFCTNDSRCTVGPGCVGSVRLRSALLIDDLLPVLHDLKCDNAHWKVIWTTPSALLAQLPGPPPLEPPPPRFPPSGDGGSTLPSKTRDLGKSRACVLQRKWQSAQTPLFSHLRPLLLTSSTRLEGERQRLGATSRKNRGRTPTPVGLSEMRGTQATATRLAPEEEGKATRPASLCEYAPRLAVNLDTNVCS
jgi:hypothetical protein